MPSKDWSRQSPLCNALDRRRLPGAVEQRGRTLLRPVEAQYQIKGPARRRQPARLLVGAGIGSLYVEINRAIGIGLQGIALTERVAIQRIGDEEILRVVHRQRPEATHRRHLALRKADDVFVGAIQLLSRAVRVGGWIDSVLCEVAPKAQSGNQCPLDIVGAIAPAPLG